MTTNPDVLKLAREIAANMCASEYMAHMTLAGARDSGDAVHAAIAAIERTTQLSKDAACNQVRSPETSDDRVWNSASVKLAETFHNYDHLRQQGQTDAD